MNTTQKTIDNIKDCLENVKNLANVSGYVFTEKVLAELGKKLVKAVCSDSSLHYEELDDYFITVSKEQL